MCGIVGFTGAAQAAPILLDGLAKLEYRGYDSAGLAVQNAAGKIEVVKAKGRLKVLSEMTDGGNALTGTCGIGHTRWATHGEPSVVNAHPHYSNDKKIAIVHNGIIENYLEIKERLTNKGFTFVSQTDTEVLAQLLDYYYMGESAGDPLDAIARTMLHVRGSYALGVLFADEPGTIYAARKDSPLVVGKAENGTLIASDVPALLKYTRTVYYIDNLEIARLTPDSIEFFDTDKEPVQHEASTIEWDTEAAEKGGFEHFMMKEIHEQPAAVRDTLSPRLKDGKIDLSELALDEDAIRGIHRIYIIGCGSAYHVGMAARYVFESLARLPVEVDVASEFRYRNPVLEPDSLALVGDQTQQMLRHYHVDTAVMSCKGIDLEAGVTDSSEFHAQTKQSMLRCAKKKILILDSSKIDKVSFIDIAPLDAFDIVVTNTAPSKPWLDFFADHNVECLYPGK